MKNFTLKTFAIVAIACVFLFSSCDSLNYSEKIAGPIEGAFIVKDKNSGLWGLKVGMKEVIPPQFKSMMWCGNLVACQEETEYGLKYSFWSTSGKRITPAYGDIVGHTEGTNYYHYVMHLSTNLQALIIINEKGERLNSDSRAFELAEIKNDIAICFYSSWKNLEAYNLKTDKLVMRSDNFKEMGFFENCEFPYVWTRNLRGEYFIWGPDGERVNKKAAETFSFNGEEIVYREQNSPNVFKVFNPKTGETISCEEGGY